MLAEQPDVLQKQVAEVGGVERLQPLLVRQVELLALAVGKARGFAGRHLFRREPAVLPAVDQHGQHARRPAFVVELLGFQDHLDDADLVVDVENREIVLQPDHLGMPAQDLHADRVEGAEPRHALDNLPDHLADAIFHLARGLVGEGDGEDFRGPRASKVENVCDAGGEHAGFAGSRAGEHQHRPVQRFHRFALLGVEVGEIGRSASPQRTRGNAARNRLRAQWSGVVTRVATFGLGHVVR